MLDVTLYVLVTVDFDYLNTKLCNYLKITSMSEVRAWLPTVKQYKALLAHSYIGGTQCLGKTRHLVT